jgi:predicted MPP superfamily phosphohydrolase
MSVRTILFVAVVLPAVLGLTGWVAHHAGEAAGLARRGRWSITAAVWAALWLPLLLRALDMVEDTLALSLLGFGVALTCLMSVPTIGFVQLVDAIARRIARRRAPIETTTIERTSEETPSAEVPEAPAASEPTEAAVAPISRREAIRRAAVGASVMVGGGSSAYGMTFGRHDYALEEVPVALSRLPRTLEGYTIAQISDVHVGAFVGDPELRAAEALIRRARPDLIVMTGDLIDHDIRYAPRLGEFVRRLEQLGARDGVVAIPGNHDYYAGVDEVLATLREAGARVLRNDGVLVPDGERASAAEVTRGFSLLGVDDLWARRYGDVGGPDLPRTLGFARPETARVLLCHNPEFFETAAHEVDLQLSGHTHGGQVTFLVRPADLFLRHGFVMGRYEREGSQLYVNRGFGTAGPPIRLATPPEVTKIVLTAR